MQVIYQKPEKTSEGTYSFDGQKIHSKNEPGVVVTSLDQLKEEQEKLLDVTDVFADYLRKYDLPDGVKGQAHFYFGLFNAQKKRKLRTPIELGKLGSPLIVVETNLGYSDLWVWPDRDYNNQGYLEMRIHGGGIAEEMTLNTLDQVTNLLEAIGKPEVASYEKDRSARDMSCQILIPVK